jgi:formate-dependent nitrite reductase membrane component NrfD
VTRPETGGSDRDRATRERVARDQGGYRPEAAGPGDRVERRGPGGGRLGPLVRQDGAGEQSMVPAAEFRSYYGRQILKTPAWGDKIAYYFFCGGVSGGCALLAAGADVTGRPALRRGTRIGGLVSLLAGAYFLVSDLGRPERFHHMLRVAKPTSPMSVGTWVLTAYGPAIGVAAAAELVPRTWPFGRLIHALGRPAGFGAAALAPALTSYGAVLLAQTAVPAWNSAPAVVPLVFTSSAGAAAGGLGLVVAPSGEAEPARRLAVAGAAAELTVSRVMEKRLGLVGETYRTGPAARYLTRATALTAAGGLGAALLGRRSRVAAAASGIALLGGSFYQRLAILHAGIQSTEDPKYVVQPQRARIAARGRTPDPLIP